jgi:hypothetical protein
MVNRRMMMKLDYRSSEEIDMIEEYEMIPLETRMYGYDQRNMMEGKGFIKGIGNATRYMSKERPSMGMCSNTNMCPCMSINSNMEMNRSVETNPSIETSPNLDLPPDMEMDPDLGTNSWMEMSQFDENMPMSGFNPTSMMYGDIFMEGDGYENGSSRHIDKYEDKYEDKEDFKEEYNKPNKFDVQYNEVDSIVRRIERYNPLVFRLLNRCGMPYPQAKSVVRRIVRLTLMYSEE